MIMRCFCSLITQEPKAQSTDCRVLHKNVMFLCLLEAQILRDETPSLSVQQSFHQSFSAGAGGSQSDTAESAFTSLKADDVRRTLWCGLKPQLTAKVRPRARQTDKVPSGSQRQQEHHLGKTKCLYCRESAIKISIQCL